MFWSTGKSRKDEEMEFSINRTDVTLMQILQSQNADNASFGMTITEIMEYMNEIDNAKSRMTIYRRLRMLSESEYIGKGVLENHADTFYLTEKGIRALKGVFE